MKKIVIEHSKKCKENGYSRSYTMWDEEMLIPCDSHFFPFQYDFEFYLLCYHDCSNNYSHHLNFSDWIFRNMDNVSKTNLRRVERKYDLRETIRRNNVESLIKQRDYCEILYTYESAANVFCYVKQHHWVDIIEKQTEYFEKYEEAKKEISEMGKNGFFDNQEEKRMQGVLFSLHSHNDIFVSEWKLVKLTDDVTQQLNLIIKRKPK